jgi:hypothetical protein
MAGARNVRHPGKRPAANGHEDQPAAAANKPGPKPGSKPKTELELLGSATNTPSMPRKRKSPAGFSPFGRASRAGKQSGPDYRQKEGKQIESGSKQDVVSALVSAPFKEEWSPLLISWVLQMNDLFRPSPAAWAMQAVLLCSS